MTGGLAAVAGLLVVGGIWLLITGIRRRPVAEVTVGARPRRSLSRWSRLTRRPAGARGRRRDLWWLVAVAAGIAIAVATGWVVAVLAVPLLMVALPAILSTPKQREARLLEALDRWVRSLVATLPTGRSIPDAIRLSRRTAPEFLAEPIGLLVSRLNGRWSPADALRRFADDLDSPDADSVVAALILAANRGSQGATTTLNELAESIQAQLRAKRVVEVERAKPYVVVRQVTVITLVAIVVVAAIGRNYFAPYASAQGQVILSVLIVLYVGTLLLMRLRARFLPGERILLGGRS